MDTLPKEFFGILIEVFGGIGCEEINGFALAAIGFNLGMPLQIIGKTAGYNIALRYSFDIFG